MADLSPEATKSEPFRGVLTVAPPAPILEAATRMVTAAAAQLSPGKSGGLFPIVTTTGVNAAIVQRVDVGHGIDVRVVAWVGKTWGEPVSAGGAGVIEW